MPFAREVKNNNAFVFSHFRCALLKYKNMAASKTNNFIILFIYAYRQNKSINCTPMKRICLLRDSPNIKILKLPSCLLFWLTEKKRVTFRAILIYFWPYLIEKINQYRKYHFFTILRKMFASFEVIIFSANSS